MIKTHKPRGYFWTHASAFQQTKEFREICYDGCAAPTAKALTPDPDETLSDVARQRKRRRIEKLADDFLNGATLFISSARPCPEALKSTIKWNQKSSTEPKFEFPESPKIQKSKLLWENVEDDSDVLRRHSTRLELSHPQGQVKISNASSVPAAEDAHDPAPRQVSRASTRFRPAHMRSGPSSDALRKAAALCARRAHTLEHEADGSAPSTGPSRRLRSEEKKTAPKHDAERLSRREPAHTPQSTNGNEESLDELRLYRIETPSNPPQKARASISSAPLPEPTAPRRESLDADMGMSFDSDSIVVTPRISETTNLQLDDSHELEPPSAGPAHNECVESNSYHTAHEETEMHEPEEDDDESEKDDSQTWLLKSQGFKGASPTAWRAVNKQPPQQSAPVVHTGQSSEEYESGVSLDVVRPEPEPAPRSTRRPARLNSTSQSETPAQRRPPTRARKQAVYKTEAGATNGASPFKWRKKVTFPSSDEIIVEPRRRPSNPFHHKDMSQSAPVTPAATAPQRSSDRDTVQPDVAHSSPVLTSHTPAANATGVTMLQQSLPETWIGTQAMLFQAQRDLLTSPEKPEQTPAITRIEEEPRQKSASQRSDREPLKHLSQEPMPSTQAMMGDFVGFSTVKKPYRGGPRESIDSPSVLLRAKDMRHKSADIESPNVSKNYPGSTRSRPSGLRYSLDSVESPLHSTSIDKPPSPKSPVIQRGTDWSSTDVATSSKKASSNNAPPKTATNHSDEVSRSDKSQSLSFSSATGLS